MLHILNYLLFLSSVQSGGLRYLDNLQGWNYINLHCRDNNNSPVDWWYIYKPPGDSGPLFATGRNFSYITPDTEGRWQPSDKYITANSMLQNTLAPLFRPTYVDYLASVAYEEREQNEKIEGSSALGVLMTDQMGGLWLTHTVPGLIDLNWDRTKFPDNELNNGHLLSCMSLDLVTLNAVTASLRQVSPRVIRMRIPPSMKSLLPSWNYLHIQPQRLKRIARSGLNFKTREKNLRVIVMVRRPGDTRCLYKKFARTKHIVLDVYGHDVRRKPICDKNYSLRNINAISLKYEEQVLYVNNETDRLGFAVSTAAHWQRTGSDAAQYWTCISNLEKMDRTAKGGLILCVENYHVWLSFDNLKIKEPDCGGKTKK